MGEAAPLLVMSGITKTFPGVRALFGAGLEVRRGEVHALLGENGAGKSTLLKILAGAQRPDSGTIRLDGETIELADPQDAQERGIVTIYQEFNLVPSLSVAENVFIGREPVRAGFVAWREMERRTAAILDEVGLAVSPTRLVSDLSVAEQQMVEIARAVSMEARLVVMDEPTSALSEHEVGKLFSIVRSLRARGLGIVFVTHRLDEVMALCDRFTVLRDGEPAGSGQVADTGVDGLVRLMVGREVERLFRHRTAARAPGEVALRVERLSRQRDPANPHATSVEEASLEVRHGEILGIAGLVGAGRSELARAIFGADPIAGGRIMVEGRELAIRSPRDAIRAGIGLVPEDRKQQALFLALAVRDNLAIAALDRLGGRLGLVDEAREARLVESFREKLNIRMAGAGQAIENLSGGNQQKVVLARWLALEPRVLIVDEPTRGIDIAAKAEVHQLLYELADSGIAVIVISSELPEVMTVSDRIITMREGRITGELPGAEADEERLMQLMALGAAA
ncbi:sugar ABC transporter ATP-binding protein [Geminicoccaceae bacterium 1502E]|nr:sugar ABC transporter ATP-binding protein [Geminicoccaceae bacterium 1502E]